MSSSRTEQANHGQNRKATIVATIIVVGFVMAAFYHYFMGTYLGLGYPFNTFLFAPGDRFNDFYNNYRQITLTGKGVFLPEHGLSNYLFFLPSLFSFHSQALAYVFYAGTFLVYLLFYNYRNFRKIRPADGRDVGTIRDTFIFTFMTYPVLFVIDRGNQEMYIFIMLSLSMFFYYREKHLLSALLLGLAVHIKMYFAVFLLLYLADKKYREIRIVVYLFIILPFLASVTDGWLFPAVQFSDSTFAFLKTAASSGNWYNTLYVLHDDGAAYCSSLYGAFKAILYFLFPHIQGGSLPVYRLFRTYFPLSLFFAGIVALYILLLEKVAWRRVTLATLSLILFPFVTADYRLIMLFIPLWMFINAKERSPHDALYAALFGLLLIPKDFFIIRRSISVSVIINPLLITTFMIFLVREGFGAWVGQNGEKWLKLKTLSWRDISHLGEVWKTVKAPGVAGDTVSSEIDPSERKVVVADITDDGEKTGDDRRRDLRVQQKQFNENRQQDQT